MSSDGDDVIGQGRQAMRVLLAPQGDDEVVELLRDWLRWWDAEMDAPAKMPAALHIQTLTYLMKRMHQTNPSKLTEMAEILPE